MRPARALTVAVAMSPVSRLAVVMAAMRLSSSASRLRSSRSAYSSAFAIARAATRQSASAPATSCSPNAVDAFCGDQFRHADDPVLDHEWNDQGGPPRDGLGVLADDGESRVVRSDPIDDGARLYGEACCAPVAKTNEAVEPLQVGRAAHDAGGAAQVVALHRVDVARRRAGDLRQAVRRGFEHAAEVERGGQVDAGLVDERRSPGAVVEKPVDASVADGLGGDLAEAADQVEASELARFAAEQGGDADDLAAVDERELHQRAVAPGEVLGPLALTDAGVVEDVGHRDRLTLTYRVGHEGEVGEVPGRSREVGVDRVADRRSRGPGGGRPRWRRCRRCSPRRPHTCEWPQSAGPSRDRARRRTRGSRRRASGVRRCSPRAARAGRRY